MKGYLVLETGHVFQGELIGSKEDILGEVVFNTSMTGYQEIITDPSYAGQILTFCYPLIGNYGINNMDNESTRPQLAAVILGESCLHPSHYLAAQSFTEELAEMGVTGLAGIDTRALVKLIREEGYVNGKITSHSPFDQEGQVTEKVLQEVDKYSYVLQPWVERVSVPENKTYLNAGPHVVLIDYGYKKSILDALLEAGCKVTVVPFSISFEEVKALQPDGILLSNGPGDPELLKPWFSEIKKISSTYPTLGICLGHQLLALAHGAKTEKLKYGHRGGNHPVKELTTGKVYITPQNHGYVVVDESINQETFQVTFINVNDRSIEGLQHKSLPIQSVQFHPEAHPGPSDTAYIFDSFIQQLTQVGEMKYAVK